MPLSEVYIVMGVSVENRDRYDWPVHAFPSREEADNMVKYLDSLVVDVMRYKPTWDSLKHLQAYKAWAKRDTFGSFDISAPPSYESVKLPYSEVFNAFA